MCGLLQLDKRHSIKLIHFLKHVKTVIKIKFYFERLTFKNLRNLDFNVIGEMRFHCDNNPLGTAHKSTDFKNS